MTSATLRPSGTTIKSLQSSSSGPVSFMGVFDAVGKAISSAGHRRGCSNGNHASGPSRHSQVLSERNMNTDSLTGFNIFSWNYR